MNELRIIGAALVRIFVLAGQAALVVLAVILLAALAYGVGRFAHRGHRAGMARLAAYDAAARSPEARRRARRARRTVIDHGTGAVTIEDRHTV